MSIHGVNTFYHKTISPKNLKISDVFGEYEMQQWTKMG